MTPGLSEIERLKALLDYHTAIAALAVLCVVAAVLFLMLIRAKDAHLKTALMLQPLAIQMTTAVQHLTSTVEMNSQLIERYLPKPAEERPRGETGTA